LLLPHLDSFLLLLNKGNSWCDEGFKNIHHFYHPRTGKGVMGLSGADTQLYDNIERAKKAYKSYSLKECYFYIGAALHLLQDLCVPHHSLGHLLKGHSDYEGWVQKHYRSFPVVDGGLYDFKHPMEVLEHNAQISASYSELITNPTEKNKIEATQELLALAQRSSAGFLYLILKYILPMDVGTLKIVI